MPEEFEAPRYMRVGENTGKKLGASNKMFQISREPQLRLAASQAGVFLSDMQAIPHTRVPTDAGASDPSASTRFLRSALCADVFLYSLRDCHQIWVVPPLQSDGIWCVHIFRRP